MTEYTRHDEGAFSWADLSTTNTTAAKKFYSTVFDWEITDEEIPAEAGGGVYLMARIQGKDVCAINEQRPDQRDAGVPPMWNVYFTVDDVDVKAKEVEASGGTVHAPPFDVMTAGRMCVATDPSGGFFCLWQAKDNIGAHVLNEPNTLGWAELYTPDIPKAQQFYSSVLGWGVDEVDMGDQGTYTLFKRGDKSEAGAMTPPTEMPTVWNIYFDVIDCDATVEKIKAGGGNVLMEPMTMDMAGRFAFVSDPQGAMFGVLDPNP